VSSTASTKTQNQRSAAGPLSEEKKARRGGWTSPRPCIPEVQDSLKGDLPLPPSINQVGVQTYTNANTRNNHTRHRRSPVTSTTRAATLLKRPGDAFAVMRPIISDNQSDGERRLVRERRVLLRREALVGLAMEKAAEP